MYQSDYIFNIFIASPATLYLYIYPLRGIPRMPWQSLLFCHSRASIGETRESESKKLFDMTKIRK